MYPVTISQSASLPNERRRNQRHRAPSIIYVQLASGNGGIVVNLGMDGVAFHAAQKLTAEKNSTLSLRLRGSGLNADLEGELVWIGPTQKEAGICFKNLPANAKQDIAHWIAREAQVFEPVGLENRPRPNLKSAMPGISATGEKSAPHSLSNALTMSRAMPGDSSSSADADANESYVGAPLDSAPGISGAAPLLEIVPPIQHRGVPVDELDEHLQSRNADSSALAEQSRVEQPLHDQGLFEPVPIDRPYQFPAAYSSPIIQSKEAAPSVHEELPAASAERPVKSELGKTEGIKSLPRGRLSLPPGNLNEAVTSEKWIPPALVAAWKEGNRQRKLKLAGAGAVCVGVCALIFALGASHIKSSVPRTAGSETTQQTAPQQSTELQPTEQQTAVQQSSEQPPTAPPAASTVSVEHPQTGPITTPPPPSATVPPQSNQPPASLLSNLENNLFGIQSDAITPITDEQIGVQVWTSQRSGYYYCTDSDYYKKVQPGAFMAQEDALQSGYRPRLRQFCN